MHKRLFIFFLLISTPLAFAQPGITTIDEHKGLQRNPVSDKIADGAFSKFDDTYIKDGNLNSVKGRDRLNSTANADITVNGLWYYESDSVRDNRRADLILHCDGVNGSTTITDNSFNPKTILAKNGAAIDTAESQFGGASCLFDGSDDRLELPDNSAWTLGTNDFTIDFWTNPDNINNVNFMGQATLGGTSGWVLSTSPTGKLRLFVNASTLILDSATSLTVDIFQHVAVAREGDTFRMFINGVLDSSTTNIISISGSDDTFFIGDGLTASGGQWLVAPNYDGHLDEIRIINGEAAYTATFTLETSAYDESGSTVTKLIVAESDEVVTYDLDGTNRTTILSGTTDIKWSAVQIGSSFYFINNQDGLHKWTGTGSAEKISTTSFPESVVDFEGTSDVGGLTADGVYSYKVTCFSKSLGIESIASGADEANLQAAFTRASGDLDTISCNSPYDTIRIYRSTAGGSDYFLVGEQSGGEFFDGKPDLALGPALDTSVEPITAPAFSFIGAYKGTLFTGEQTTVQFSRVAVLLDEDADKYYLPADRFELASTREITGIRGTSNSLLIFTSNMIEQITGFGQPSFNQSTLIQGIGAITEESIVVDSQRDLIFFAGISGVYKLRTFLQSTDDLTGSVIDQDRVRLLKISSPDMDEVFRGEDDQIDLDPADYTSSHAYYDFDNDLYFLYIDEHQFIFDNVNQAWTHIPATQMVASTFQRSPNASGQGTLLDNKGFFYDNWTGYENGVESGTVTGSATSSTSLTLTDTSATFNTTGDGLTGTWIFIDNENGEYRQIASNTATVITIDIAWTNNPATSDDYFIAHIIPIMQTKQYQFAPVPKESEISNFFVVHNKSDSTQLLEVQAFENKNTLAQRATDVIDLTDGLIDKIGLRLRSPWTQVEMRTFIYNTSDTISIPMDIISYAFESDPQRER